MNNMHFFDELRPTQIAAKAEQLRLSPRIVPIYLMPCQALVPAMQGNQSNGPSHARSLPIGLALTQISQNALIGHGISARVENLSPTGMVHRAQAAFLLGPTTPQSGRRGSVESYGKCVRLRLSVCKARRCQRDVVAAAASGPRRDDVGLHIYLKMETGEQISARGEQSLNRYSDRVRSGAGRVTKVSANAWISVVICT